MTRCPINGSAADTELSPCRHRRKDVGGPTQHLTEVLAMKLVTVLSVLVGSLMVAGQVRAKGMHSYDLDSLVYLSTEVAEVEIARSYEAHGLELIDVKVTLVHKGGFKKEQTVIVWD